MAGFVRRRQVEFARGIGDFTEYVLADRLRKSIREIREMDNTEYLSWIAYLRLEHERANRGPSVI